MSIYGTIYKNRPKDIKWPGIKGSIKYVK